MKIGELAKKSACPVKTIRYYEDIGLLEKASRDINGYRNYQEDALAQLRFIKSAQTAGLSLKEIAEIILIRKSGTTPCFHVQQLLTKHLTNVEEKLSELERTRGELEKLILYANSIDPIDCEDESICIILHRPIDSDQQ